jgi:3-phenylpropionate/trans-cinnamate dioxygenase ferredoxin reductase subunit
MPDSIRTIAIVGGGMAGAKAAETLREEGFDGRVVLIGAEPERPYERPPLSKDYLRGEVDRTSPRVHDEGFYEERSIELMTPQTVTRIDAGGRALELGDGDRIEWDRLLIATGAEPRRLPLPGADLPGVHLLRTLADSDTLRTVLQPGAHIAIVGAGWIGCEVSASARMLGCEVTLIESADLPLERVLGRELATVYRDVHVEKGVRLEANASVEGFEGNGAVRAVRLGGGRRIDCDAVLVAIGVAPRVRLADEAGIPVENGVLVDESLASEAPGVYAAGDVANAWNPRLGQRIRVEHWANALHGGPVAARAMLGRELRADDIRIPYFFSDQYDVGMEYSGHAPEYDEVVYRGDPASREFIGFYLAGGRVVATINVNVWDVSDDLRAVIASGATVDRARLADPDTPLAELAPARE